jgi:hypothetical protein
MPNFILLRLLNHLCFTFYKNFDGIEDWPRDAVVVDSPAEDDLPGGDIEEIRKRLKKLEDVPRVIIPFKSDIQMQELIVSVCNPANVEYPNLVSNYIAVKQYVYSCL